MHDLRAGHAFSFAGTSVRYARLGQGPAMVCLHNGGTSSTIWRHVAPAFARRREVFALDLPGFGASVHPTGLRLAELVELVITFLVEEGLAPVELVGNCMGSAIAIRVAAARPELVRSLVLFNPLSEATFRAGHLGILRSVDRHAPVLFNVADTWVGGKEVPATIAQHMLRAQLGHAGRAAKLYADPSLVSCYTRPHQLSALRFLLSDMGSFRSIDEPTPSPTLAPTCTIWGEQNRILSASAGRALNETLQPSRQAWLADCGHLPMLERPEACLDIMSDFLKAPAPNRTP